MSHPATLSPFESIATLGGRPYALAIVELRVTGPSQVFRDKLVSVDASAKGVCSVFYPERYRTARCIHGDGRATQSIGIQTDCRKNPPRPSYVSCRLKSLFRFQTATPLPEASIATSGTSTAPAPERMTGASKYSPLNS